MKKLTITTLFKLLKEKSEKEVLINASETLESELTSYIETKAVLGIDIFQYSKFPNVPQMLIPYFFRNMYEVTLNRCFENEPFIFQKTSKEKLREQFIDTGDGGFQIFDSPLEALVFSMYLQANLALYNSRSENTKHIYDVINEVTFRFSLTFDTIYAFEKNYYGTSIINCARIISKDKLNRFLIDDKTKVWFNHNFNGIETLTRIYLQDDYSCIDYFSKYDSRNIKSLIFGNADNRIKKLDLMKIGEISSKSDILSIHNLHLQVDINVPKSKFKKVTASIGNLNTAGIND